MFHRVEKVSALPDYKLSVRFCEGITKTYDVKPLFEKWKPFLRIKDNELFYAVFVDDGGYGICWDDDIDLSCDELFENGEIQQPESA